MTIADDAADELATNLAIGAQAIEEAIHRGQLSFVTHRNFVCWRFGDSRNASFRRVDGEPFRIRGEPVKAEAETRGQSWHHLIGMDDVLANGRRDILLTPEGSKDALAVFHFADAEGTLSSIGVVAALGTGINLLTEDVEPLLHCRVRIIADIDQEGVRTAERIGERLAPVAAEVQMFNLAGLNRCDGSPVKDLFDLTRIDYDDFEANRDLWSITDLDSRGERVQIITDSVSSSPPLPLSPHVSPEYHGSLVYPVSNSPELEKELQRLAARNACTERNAGRVRRWKLLQDLAAVQKRIARKLATEELMATFDIWYRASHRYLDPQKTRDDYLAKFLAELGKVRVPTGDGEALKVALGRISVSPLPKIPGMPDAKESWRTLAALHRELASQSANGNYFLSCRDAAKAHPDLNKDSANTINGALGQLGVIKLVRVGDSCPGGNASEFRYLLPD